MYTNTDYTFESESALLSQDYLFNPTIEYIEKIKPKSILDVGCGNGAIANELIKRGFNVYGVDASEMGINFANKINPNRFFLCDFDTMQLPETLPIKEFDLVISTEVIEHVYSPESFMGFCKMALKKDGHILLSTPYHGYIKNLVLSLTGKMDSHFNVLWEGGHIKFWSVNTLSTILDKYGFGELGFIGCGRMPYLWKSMIMTGKLIKK
jgi:2-polyprenyl-3-methyl-5-hydroxy-6-metoxy-1,4-benzoquinol methylase